MANKRVMNLTARLPTTTDPELGAMARAVADMHRIVVDRTEDLLDEGTLAKRPAAKGNKRLYYSTDTKIVHYDAGSWQGPHLEVISTASLPAAGAVENGRVVIEDNGAGDRNLVVYAGGQRFRIDGGAAF